MHYKDILYGSWELPSYLRDLAQTKEMVRMRGITMGTVPNILMPHGALPSRFEHGLGVAFLALQVLENCMKLDKQLKSLLVIASLLHDAGNPPFAHLSEHFLKKICGKDGESFVTRILDGTQTEKILIDNGLTLDLLTKMITGDFEPFSKILNGSLDIDNLDNVRRYAYYRGLSAPYDPIFIADHFMYDKIWRLHPKKNLDIFAAVNQWKKSRKTVYEEIYSSPHLIVAMMLYRAIELAFEENLLNENFFLLTDYEALIHLVSKCRRSELLIERIIHWQLYEEIMHYELTDCSNNLKTICTDKESKMHLASNVVDQIKIKPEGLCIYAGKSRAFRKVSLPFLVEGLEVSECLEVEQKYNFFVYIDPAYDDKRCEVINFLKSVIE